MADVIKRCILGPTEAGWFVAKSQIKKPVDQRPVILTHCKLHSKMLEPKAIVYKKNSSAIPKRVDNILLRSQKPKHIECLLVDSKITKTRSLLKRFGSCLDETSTIVLLNQSVSLWEDCYSLFPKTETRPRIYLGRFQTLFKPFPFNLISDSFSYRLNLSKLPRTPLEKCTVARACKQFPLNQRSPLLNLMGSFERDYVNFSNFSQMLSAQLFDSMAFLIQIFPTPLLRQEAANAWIEVLSKLPYFHILDKSFFSPHLLLQSSENQACKFFNIGPQVYFDPRERLLHVKELLKFALKHIDSNDSLFTFLKQTCYTCDSPYAKVFQPDKQSFHSIISRKRLAHLEKEYFDKDVSKLVL